jgi:hypothetical protein
LKINNEKNCWIPYSVGCLWSYCQQFDDIQNHFQLAGLYFNRATHEEVLETMHEPAVVGFSCYQWNKEYNLALAEKIKGQWPNSIIVFGGPEITESFTNYTFIDSIVFAEGEQSFLDILRKCFNKELVPAVYDKSRLENLNYPSPYSSGVFNQIVKDNPDTKWAAVIETNRGCPFSCTFCDWGSLTYSKVRQFSLERIEGEVDWIASNPVAYLNCADANFGIFKERDVKIAQMIYAGYRKSDTLETFNATFNKNNNEWSFKILEELKECSRGLTVSVQSLNKETLKAIKRANLGINDLKKIFDLCQKYDFYSYTEIILGLPYETKESFKNGLCELLELGQHNHIDIWLTDMLVNSELTATREQYGIQTTRTDKLFALYSDDNYYPEFVEIVKATNTMSTEDMIESFMYGWMILNFHLQGYTQIISRYNRLKYDISYREFYDQLMENILNDPALRKIYDHMRLNIEQLLRTGTFDDTLISGGHNIIFLECLDLYKHKEHIFNLYKDNDIIDLQRHFIFDVNQTYPLKIDCDFDIKSNIIKDITYNIESKVMHKSFEEFEETFYILRRKGILKNRLT